MERSRAQLFMVLLAMLVVVLLGSGWAGGAKLWEDPSEAGGMGQLEGMEEGEAAGVEGAGAGVADAAVGGID